MLSSAHSRTWMDLGLAGCGFAVWLAMAGCEGSATQTTTGKGIQGVLVDTRGNPVGGATVRAWPAAYGPIRAGMPQDSGQAVSVRTDEHGRYAIADLEVGVYNLFGANPSNRATVLIPRVKYLEQTADLGTDTLKAPGVIVGNVRVDGAPPMTFCYLEGSNYAAISDATGRFVLPDLAEGVYRLNYYAPGYAGAVDSIVTVRSGDTTRLADKTLLPDVALTPPAPHGVSASYDTVHGVAHLKWNAVHVSDLSEYVIEFEDSPALGQYSVHSISVPDTFLADDAIGYYGVYAEGTEPFTRSYWVRAKDSENNLSPRPAQPVIVRFADPTIFQTVFTMHPILDSAMPGRCRDTAAFALDMVSSPDSSLRVQWRVIGDYHSDQTQGGPDWNTRLDSIGASTGVPRRDTMYVTRQTLDNLEASGSNIAFDSFQVRAYALSDGALVHMVTASVDVDSAGCFHPQAATSERSRGKPPY